MVYNYWCTDCTCGKELKTTQRYFHIESDIESIDEQENIIEYCPNIPENEITENIEKMKLMGVVSSGGFLKSSIMTQEQKKTFFKKRSHEHFEKHVKDKKHEMDRGTFSGSRENINK